MNEIMCMYVFFYTDCKNLLINEFKKILYGLEDGIVLVVYQAPAGH